MVDTDSDGIRETFIGSTLDGQQHHGWKIDDAGNPTGTLAGLFQAAGNEPSVDREQPMPNFLDRTESSGNQRKGECPGSIGRSAWDIGLKSAGNRALSRRIHSTRFKESKEFETRGNSPIVQFQRIITVNLAKKTKHVGIA